MTAHVQPFMHSHFPANVFATASSYLKTQFKNKTFLKVLCLKLDFLGACLSLRAVSRFPTASLSV